MTDIATNELFTIENFSEQCKSRLDKPKIETFADFIRTKDQIWTNTFMECLIKVSRCAKSIRPLGYRLFSHQIFSNCPEPNSSRITLKASNACCMNILFILNKVVAKLSNEIGWQQWRKVLDKVL